MSVVDVPLGNLDNESDLLDWLAAELVANHRFTERRRKGSVGSNNIQFMLSRPQSETYHDDAPMLLWLDKGTNSEGVVEASSVHFNLSWKTYEQECETTTPASVTVTITDGAGIQRLDITAGAFTNWTTGGYSAGQYIRVTDAAIGANNGLFYISAIGTGAFPSSLMTLKSVQDDTSDPGLSADTGDVITVVEEKYPNTTGSSAINPSGFFNAETSDTSAFNAGVHGLYLTWPYLRARLITNPTSNSATPSEPLHFILVVETDADIYRKMSFGEVVKLVEFNGGHYFAGDRVRGGEDIDGALFPWLQGSIGSTLSENGNIGGNPGGVYSSDWVTSGTTDENGRGWFGFGVHTSGLGGSPTHWQAVPFPHYKGIGAHLIGYSPSGFSGQSERWPITIFGHFENRLYNQALAGFAPMCVIPDVFLADITNVDAYSVFQDDYGEKFMVVPFKTKAGSGVGSTEKWGYLIRNPDLVVT